VNADGRSFAALMQIYLAAVRRHARTQQALEAAEEAEDDARSELNEAEENLYRRHEEELAEAVIAAKGEA
jgi:hypothetical protein